VTTYRLSQVNVVLSAKEMRAFTSGLKQYIPLPWLTFPMDMARIFGLPAALPVTAVAANRLSRWTRVPDIIVLLLIGVGLGPVLK
jgi:hypothetical protein